MPERAHYIPLTDRVEATEAIPTALQTARPTHGDPLADMLAMPL